MILFEYDKKKYEKALREYIREEERAEGISIEQAQRIAELDDEKTKILLEGKKAAQ